MYMLHRKIIYEGAVFKNKTAGDFFYFLGMILALVISKRCTDLLMML